MSSDQSNQPTNLLQEILNQLMVDMQTKLSPEMIEKLQKEFGKDPKNWTAEKIKAAIKKTY